MKKMRIGIIGLGNQGSSYLFNIFEQGKVAKGEVVAVCDTNPAKIENVKSKTTIKDLQYFTDYVEMLDSGLCDLIMVETPHYYHPEIVMECLKRDIHAIVDKPAGVYTEHVKEMNEFAKGKKAKFTVMFNQRMNCIYRKMREIIQEGGIGELQRVTWIITDWYRTQAYYNTGSWRATWKGEGGGVLINQCPHQLDLVQWVVGQLPQSVRGFCKYGKWHDIEVEDEVTAYFEYANGASGVFITTTGEFPGTNRFEISGTKGKLLCEDGKLRYHKLAEDSQVVARRITENPFEDIDVEEIDVETDGSNPQHAGIINNFIGSLLGEEETFVKGEDGLACVELMNAIELSGWLGGEKVTLPVDEKKYLKLLNEKRANSKEKAFVNEVVADTSKTYGDKK